MDNDTFVALTEALAIECVNDPSKYNRFASVFFEVYKNRSISFLDLDSLYEPGSTMAVVIDGNMNRGYLTAHKILKDEHSYAGYSHSHARGYRIKLEIAVR